jgi:aminoglycoside 9-adenylyltransferase
MMPHADRPAGQPLPKEADAAFEVLARELGEALIGVYLFGSALRGGLRPNSDVDLLAIVDRPPGEPTRRRLVEALMRVSGSPVDDGSPRPLEVTLLCRQALVPWHYPPRSELVYGEWLRDGFEQGRIPPAATDPDLAIVLATARERSRSLCGPELAELLPSIPEADLRRAVLDSLPGLLEGLPGDERNVLLTLARMWRTAETGEIVPKDVAAAWALKRLPEALRPLLAMARQAYLEGGGDDWTPRMAQMEVLAAFMRLAIEQGMAAR